MSNEQRASLMALKKPLLKSGETAPAAELTRSLPGEDNRTDVQPAVQHVVQQSWTRLTPKPLKSREVTVSATFRLPEALHNELKRIALHNRLNMTDIVIEALEIHLRNFTAPG